jgi:hypothetical protein
MLWKSRWRSHEFGEKPPPLVVDSQIQVISLLLGWNAFIYKCNKKNLKNKYLHALKVK